MHIQYYTHIGYIHHPHQYTTGLQGTTADDRYHAVDRAIKQITHQLTTLSNVMHVRMLQSYAFVLLSSLRRPRLIHLQLILIPFFDSKTCILTSITITFPQPIVPIDIFNLSMGSLINAVVHSLTNSLLAIEDIAAVCIVLYCIACNGLFDIVYFILTKSYHTVYISIYLCCIGRDALAEWALAFYHRPHADDYACTTERCMYCIVYRIVLFPY